MGVEVIRDEKGREHIIFDNEKLYDDEEIGDKLEDFEILQSIDFSKINSVLTLEYFKVRSLINHKIYTMKKGELDKPLIESEDNKKTSTDYLLNEFILAKELNDSNHPNIIKYYKQFKDKNFIYTIMEYSDNGNISEYIDLSKSLNKPIREEILWSLFYQCISSLKYLHSKLIIHRNIKGYNLFMFSDGTVKLGDFTVSTKFNHNNYTVVGGGAILNPEMLNKEDSSYNDKLDVFLLGCEFFRMCFWENPYDTDDPEDPQLIDIRDQKKNENEYSDDLKKIIDEMIDLDPQKRKSSKEIYDLVEKEYNKRCLMNTGLDSAIRCLSSFENLTKKMRNKPQTNEKKLTILFINCIKMLKESSGENDNYRSFLGEIRKLMSTEFNVIKNNKEIDPILAVSFLLRKMHNELNDLGNGYNAKINVNPMEKAEVLKSYFNFFKNNFNSIISNLFFGAIKEKRVCMSCKSGHYSFNPFYILNVDIEEVVKLGKNMISLEDCFRAQSNHFVELNLDKCANCKKCQRWTEQKNYRRIYYTPYNFIINFDRSEHCKNDKEIYFELKLNVQEFVEFSKSPLNYILVGIIRRIEKDKRKKYISLTFNQAENIWILTDGFTTKKEKDPLSFKEGIVLMLFYTKV